MNLIKKYFYPIAILAVALIGLALRLNFLDKMGSYFFDEMASLVIARFNFPEIIEYLAAENNPPLSFLFLHFWIKIFGEGEKIVRISSLIFGVAAIPMTYLAGKEIFSKKAGFFAALFMSLSFFQIYYSTEARMYPLFLFLALVSIYFYWMALKENLAIFWIFYAFFSILLVNTHIFGWAVIIFQSIFFLIYRKNYAKTQKLFLGTNVIIFLSFLPWLALKIKTTALSSLSDGWYFKKETDVLEIADALKKIVYFESFGRYAELLLALIFLISIAAVFFSLIRRENAYSYIFNLKIEEKTIFVLLWIIIPLLIDFSLSMTPKYIIFIGPALYLLAVKGISNLKLRFEHLMPLVLFVSLGLFMTSFDNIKNSAKINTWDDAANSVFNMEKPGDKIILHNFVSVFEFKQYYKGGIPYEGFYIFNDNDESDKIIIKRNWNTIIAEQDYAKADFKLKAMTKGFKRIFLIESKKAFDPDSLVITWFEKNNWLLKEKIDLTSYVAINNDNPKIWLWEKIDQSQAAPKL